MERHVASNPGARPPTQAVSMTAKTKSERGAASRCSSGNCVRNSAMATEKTAIPCPQIWGSFGHRSGLDRCTLLFRETANPAVGASKVRINVKGGEHLL